MCLFCRERTSVLHCISTIDRRWDYEQSTPPVASGAVWQWGRRSRSGRSEWLKTERDDPRWPLSLLWKEPTGPSCSRKVRDSSLTRKFKCVCDRGGWPSAGLNGRLMGGGSEPDGLWGALFSLPPPVIHHISSWYWAIAVSHWWEGGQGSRRRGWGAGDASWLETGTGTWLLHIIMSV